MNKYARAMKQPKKKDMPMKDYKTIMPKAMQRMMDKKMGK